MLKKELNRLCILMCFALLSATAVQAQQAPNLVDSKGRKQGLWEKTYEDGTPMYRGTFKDDKPIGEFKRFYADSSLQAEMVYDKTGIARTKMYFPESGTLMAQGNYIDQKRDSIWLFFSEDSVLASAETYQNGQRHGLTTIFYPSGNVFEKVMYREGVKDGLWQQFFENGEPMLEATVENGVSYEGKYVSYYPGGVKMMEGKYVDGEKEGSWYEFHEDGSLKIIYLYRNGKVVEEYPKNGLFESYYPNDIKKDEYTYKNGVKSGPFKEYYHKGEWITEEVEDEFGGKRPVQRLYGTQVKREGKFLDGELHGEIVTYTEEGKVAKKETFKKGVPVE